MTKPDKEHIDTMFDNASRKRRYAAMAKLAYDIHQGIPFDEYMRLDAVSSTQLKWMAESPRLYAHNRAQPIDTTDAMRVGHATHTAVLEPDEFSRRYIVWPKKAGRRYGKKWDAYCAAAEIAEHTILTEAQDTTAKSIRDAVRSHEVAKRYLESGQPEVTSVWVDPDTGLVCKSRLDWVNPSLRTLIEFKTTRDPRPDKFAADSARRFYHLQLAHYYAGWRANRGNTVEYKVIAAQNCPPWDVVVYDVTDDMLLAGEYLCAQAMERLQHCRETDSWPGIAPDQEVTLGLPVWAEPANDDEPLTFNGEAMEGF